MLGMFVGDAIAMPVHWYYDLRQLRADYGSIARYTAPKDHFKNSILNLSNTGGGGRGSDQGDIVGKIILHGKKQYWVRGGNYHYHLGLQAGENTLEAQLARLLTQQLQQKAIDAPEILTANFLKEYVRFMTTPGSHNDTCRHCLCSILF